MNISVNNIEKTKNENIYEGVFSIDDVPYDFTFNAKTNKLEYIDAGDDLEYNLDKDEKRELYESILNKVEQLNKSKEYVPYEMEEPVPHTESQKIIYGIGKKIIPEVMAEFQRDKLSALRELDASRKANDKVFENKVRSIAMTFIKAMKNQILDMLSSDVAEEDIKGIIDKIAKYVADSVITDLSQTDYKKINYNYIDGIFEITADDKEAVMTHWFNEEMTGPNRKVRVPASEYDYKKENGIQFIRYDIDKKNFSLFLENEDIVGKKFILNKNNLSNYQGDYKDVVVIGGKASLDYAEMALLPNDKSNAFIGTADLSADEIMKYHYDEFISQEKDGKVYNYRYFLGVDKDAVQHINDIISESNSHFIKDNYDLYKKADFLAAVSKGFSVEELKEFYATSYEKLEIEEFIDNIKEFEISGDLYVATINENNVEIYRNGDVAYANYFNDREKAQEAFDMLGDSLETEEVGDKFLDKVIEDEEER